MMFLQILLFLGVITQDLIAGSEFCKKVNQLTNICEECEENFILTNQTCVGDCPQFQYFNKEQNECTSSCEAGYLRDQTTQSCLKILNCPTLFTQGNQFHASVTITDLQIDLVMDNFYSFSNEDQEIKLWEKATGRLITTFRGHEGNVLRIEFFDQLINWEDLSLSYQDWSDFTPKMPANVTDASSIPQFKFLVSLSSIGQVNVWDRDQGSVVKSLQFVSGVPNTNSEINTKFFLTFSFGIQGEFYVLNYLMNDIYKFEQGHTEKSVGAVFLQFNKFIYSFGEDGRILRWKLVFGKFINNQPQFLCKMDGPVKSVKLLDSSSNSASFIAIGGIFRESSADKGNSVDLFLVVDEFGDDKNSQSFCQAYKYQNAHLNEITGIYTDTSSQAIFTTSDSDQVIKSWNFQGSTKKLKLVNVQNVVYGKLRLFSEENQVLITGENSNAAYLYDFQSQNSKMLSLSKKISNQYNPIKGGILDKLGNNILTFGIEINLFNLNSGSELNDNNIIYQIQNLTPSRIQHSDTIVGYHMDSNNLFISASQDGRIILWDGNTRGYETEISHPQKLPVQQSRIYGNILLGLFEDNSIVIFDYLEEKVIKVMENQFTEPIVQFGQDWNGLPIFLVASSNNLQVYSVNDGTKIISKTLPEAFDHMQCFSPFLLTASKSGKIYNLLLPELQIQSSITNGNVKITHIHANLTDYINLMIVSFENQTIGIYSLPDLIKQQEFIPCVNEIPNLAFLPLYPGAIIATTYTGTMCALDPITGNPIYYTNLMNGYPIDGIRQLNYIKGALWADYGGVYGILTIIDVMFQNIDFVLTTPPITQVEVDEWSLELHVSTVTGRSLIFHYLLSIVSGIYRDERQDTIQTIIPNEDLNIFFVIGQKIELFNLMTNTLLDTNTKHTGDPLNGVFVGVEQNFYSYSSGNINNLISWKIYEKQYTILAGHTSGINGIFYNSFTNELLSFGSDSLLLVWKNNIKIKQMDLHKSSIIMIVVSEQKEKVVSLDADQNIIVWDSKNNQIKQNTRVLDASGLLLDDENQIVFVYGKSIRVYNLNTGGVVAQLAAHKDQIIQMIMNANYIISYDNLEVRSYVRLSRKLNLIWFPKKPINHIEIYSNYVIASSDQVEDIYRWNFIDGLELYSIKIEPLPGQDFDQNPPFQIKGDYENNYIFKIAQYINTISSKAIYVFNPDKNPPQIATINHYYQLPAMQTEDFLILRRSNLIIMWTKSDISIYKYYSIMSDPGLPMELPLRANYLRYFKRQDNQLSYIDKDSNFWFQTDNTLTYQQTVEYNVQQMTGTKDHLFIYTNDQQIIALDSNLQSTTLLKNTKLELFYTIDDQNIIILVSRNGTISLYNSEMGQKTLEFIIQYRCHYKRVSGLRVDKEQYNLISYDIDGKICIFNYIRNELLQETKEHTNGIQGLEFNSLNNLVASYSRDGVIYIWDYLLSGFRLQQKLESFAHQVESLKISTSTLQLFAIADSEPNMVVWEMKAFKLKSKILCPGDYRKKLYLNDDVDRLAISNPFQVNVYQTSTMEFINLIRNLAEISKIEEVYLLNQDLVLLLTLSRIQVYSVDSSSVILKQNFQQVYAQLVYPPVLLQNKVIKSNPSTLYLLGISENSIFNYTVIITKENYEACSHQFFDTSYYFIVRQQLTLIETSLAALRNPIQATVYDIYLQENQAFLIIDDFTNYQKLHEIQINYRSGNSGQVNVIKVGETSFLNFQLEELILENFLFNFSEPNIQIQFNQKTTSIQLSDVSFTKILKNVSFDFSNMDSVSFQNLNLINNELIAQETPLFFFNKTNIVKIISSNISNLNSKNLQLFSFLQVQKLQIINFNIEKVNIESFNVISTNNISNSIFQMTNSFEIALTNISFKNIIQTITFPISDSNKTRLLATQTQKVSHIVLMEMKGITQARLNSLTFQNLSDIVLFKASSFYETQNQKIILQKENTLEIDRLLCTNNKLSYTEVQQLNDYQNDNMIFINTLNFQLTNSKIVDNICSECSPFEIYQSNFDIQNLTAANNTGKHGGVIFIRESLIRDQVLGLDVLQNKFNGTVFRNNSAAGSGGAIFSINSDYDFFNSVFVENKAEIGGAIRFIQKLPTFAQNNSQQQVIQTSQNASLKTQQYKISISEQNITFEQNYASIIGQQFISYPDSVQILKEEDTLDGENIIKIEQIRSGQTFNFRIFFKDSLHPSEYYNLDQNLTEYTQLTQSEIRSIQFQFYQDLSEAVKIDGKSLSFYTDYEQNSSSFLITNMMLSKWPISSSKILFRDSYSQTVDLSFMFVLREPKSIPLKFRQCIRGEILTQTSTINEDNIIECFPCPQGQYSLTIPEYQVNEFASYSSSCQVCPYSSSDFCEGDQIVLKNGFWRQSQSSDIIEECQNQKDLCVGTPEKNYCLQGHIGPLCEECDTYGQLWNLKYGNLNQFQCIQCSDKQGTVAFFLLNGLFLFAYTAVSIRSVIMNAQKGLSITYLRLMGISYMTNNENQDLSSFVIKSLMHYAQIVSILSLTNFQLSFKLPYWVSFIPELIGQPVKSLKNSFDCTVPDDGIPVIYFNLIWTLIIPFLYVGGLGLVYLVLIKLKKLSHQNSYITSGIVFLIDLMQPGIISLMVAMISCRTIGQQSYINEDLRYQCYTEQHLSYIYGLIIPALLLWGLVLPLALISYISKNKDQLNYFTLIVGVGFLYQDYKPQFYYWEFFKITLKMYIVFIHNSLTETKIIQCSFIILALFLYNSVSFQNHPILHQQVNMIDSSSHSIITILIIFKIIVLSSQIEALRLFSIFTILIINYMFIFYLICLFLQMIINIIKVKLIQTIISKQDQYKFFDEMVKKFNLQEKDQSRPMQNWKRCHQTISNHFILRKLLKKETEMLDSKNNEEKIIKIAAKNQFQLAQSIIEKNLISTNGMQQSLVGQLNQLKFDQMLDTSMPDIEDEPEQNLPITKTNIFQRQKTDIFKSIDINLDFSQKIALDSETNLANQLIDNNTKEIDN